MRTMTPSALLMRAALAVLALAAAASAQGPVDARSALSAFPDSQAVLFVNARRITSEALPRLLPKAEYDKMLAQARQVGFDVRDIDYIAVGARFADPAQPSGIPEVLLVVRGQFSADALLALARVAASTQSLTPNEESYGGKTLQVFDLTRLGQPSGGDGEGQAPKPPPLPFKEIAATALDANTLVIGVPAYVRAAVDASGGQGRLKSSLVELASRDPHTLWSLTAELPPNLAQYAQQMGLPKNEEAERILGWLRQVSFSNGMDALNFTVRAAVLADSPEHANAISGLIGMGVTALQTSAENDIEKKRAKPAEARQAQIALRAIRTITNQTEGSAVMIGGSFPQAALAEVVRKEFIKKPAAPVRKPRRRAARRR
jgi:hypothetical protein